MGVERMYFLQVGLGSMGKRRIRNLMHHGVSAEHIAAFDTDAQRRAEAEEQYGVTTFSSWQEALASRDYDAFIISTPPHTHHTYFLEAARRGCHFFVEVTTTDAGYDELLPLLKNNTSLVAAPSSTFQYFSAVVEMSNVLKQHAIGTPLAFTYHMGQYLPDWHPWEDYRQVYFSKKETGACREMFVYELLWLSHLFQGMPHAVAGMHNKVSQLDMTADDVYAFAVTMDSNVTGTVLIDLLSRKPYRTLRIIGSEGIIEWDWQSHSITVYDVGSKSKRAISVDQGNRLPEYVSAEDMYQAEMESFLKAVSGVDAYPHTFEKNRVFLRLLEQFEQTGRGVV